MTVPEEYHDLFERPTFAHVATLLPNGLPHVTPVWIDYDNDDDRILVNTERGRRKERNMRQNPYVGVSMLDPDDPYRYLSVAGEVTDLTTDGAREHIDVLAQRYFDRDYDNPIETERVIAKIRADEVF